MELATQIKQLHSQVMILSRDIICGSNQAEVQDLEDMLYKTFSALKNAWMAVRAQQELQAQIEGGK